MSLAIEIEEGAEPAFVLMHFLGGSACEWDEAAPRLSPHKVVRIDLPGFGGSADVPGYSIAGMADAVDAAIARAGLTRYILAGHSMSGSVAMVLARRAQDSGNRALRGLVLVAPSPPGPEPMTEEKRGRMIASLGTHHDDDLERARLYITKNESRDLPKDVEERAAREVLRMNRTAWVAWLTHGSKEDWAERVGVLDLPTLVVAGGKDESLGPETQRQLTLPHLGRGRIETLAGCSHLVPMERPAELASLMLEFAAGLDAPSAVVPKEYLEFLASDRVSPRTREVVEARLQAPQAAAGRVLSPGQERTLRAALERVLPQGSQAIDIAATIVARLAQGKGDGWRYDVLPKDLTAYREQLDKLTANGFLAMNAGGQDAALRQLAAHPGSAEARWFEELRSDAVEAYMAHPATLARLGYSGIGVGGANTPHRGYVTLGPNQREAWEPLPEVAR
jgi:pimeloyl-ACP methyl ester carboxylesterase